MNLKQELLGILKFRPVRLAALVLLIVGVGTACFVTKLAVLDLDVWWHLAVGNWIVQHHAVPHSGIFSRVAAERPWMAYSWGYEVPLSWAYSALGFLGVALFGCGITIAVAVALFWMIYRLSRRFWFSVVLCVPVYFAFLFNIMPRPLFGSMLMFTITVTLLLDANRTGRASLLYWLPLVFLFWANLHVQFIYGLFVYGLFVAVHVLQSFVIPRKYPQSLTSPKLPLKPVLLAGAACVAATCVGPYSFHIYRVVFSYASSKVIYSMLTEMQALSFLGPSHFVELLLAAGAFVALGWQKKLDLFRLLLLVAASVLGFRMTRDAWFLCITAAAVIADLPAPETAGEETFRLPELAAVALASALLLVLVARNTDFDQRGIDRVITSQFPVDAVNYIRQHPVGGPLYNSFNWGGFLIFYMPEYPVAIDGRTDLYGDDLDAHFYATENAEPSYSTDPHLADSGLVILQNRVPLAKVLPTDRRFRVIYRDDVATVLAHN